MTENIDRARLMLMLNELRLPAIKQNWPDFAERADKEGSPAARLLAALAEHEIAERDRLVSDNQTEQCHCRCGHSFLS